ncbi:MAG: sigma-70 family RNA polymerase sigma factor, partial [Bacteroidales bacterium]|jgi:RNA polymerase primary sigma factor|nr:sigma-70 family RNA polymerase sigma factor [Bacteroidales bacterium]
LEEIALRLDLTEAEVKDSLRNSSRHLSMDASLTQDEDNNMYDVMKSEESPTPDTGLLYESLKLEINRVITTLPQREADVLKLYFGLDSKHPMTLEEIGEKFDLTRERVRQIKEKAIRRLKHSSKCKNLKAYLG